MSINNTPINNLYPVANALASDATFVDVITTRDPTSNDNQYQTQKKWLNSTTNNLWYLKSFTPTSTQILANWVLIAGSIGAVEKLQGNTGGAVGPDMTNIIHTVGDGIGITVAGNPGTNTLTWSLVGGGIATEKFQVDTFTSPGTNPVPPTALGLVTVTGGQVPAGTTGNVIQTNSLAPNTYTIQVQRSQAVASSTIGDNGVCHFKSADFNVDSNAFVSLVTPSPKGWINSIHVQVITSTGTYTPTSGMQFVLVRQVGGGGGGAGIAASTGSNISVGVAGSSGSYSEGFFLASTIGASQSVTIGAGGTAGASGGGAGGNGGQTSFGSLMTAPGGIGATQFVTGATQELTANPPNSAGTGGYLNLTRSPGFGGVGTNGISDGGWGANSVFGGAGTGGRTPPSSSINATNYGSGGAGAMGIAGDPGKAGGTGSPGICIITEFLSI